LTDFSKEFSEEIRSLPLNGSQESSTDIVVVGAGLAGATAAAVLGQQVWRVLLVDPRPTCPPIFKAEKIEPDQAELLRKLGLLDHLASQAGCIREVRAYYNGRLFKTAAIEQYGLHYSDMVNALRAHLPASVEFKLERVVQIVNSPELQRVKLAGGEECTCRLVVLACGPSADLLSSLKLRRTITQKDQSVAIAFTIARPDGLPFPFDAITYYPTSCADSIDYLSLFSMGSTMRANLFAFRAATDPWLRQFTREPGQMLQRCLPMLSRAIGEYRVVSKVETSRTDLYRTEGDPPPGVVLIGDAAQNVCPSTGMGLSKIFTDVDVLCSDCIPLWFASPGMDRDKVTSFYSYPRKRATDAKALQSAFYRRRASTDRSLRWRIHRLRIQLSRRFGG
jgi:2-polyprenyl-6-methoxyphenol hydroxylase-like FAD-dependent oxidoreductase